MRKEVIKVPNADEKPVIGVIVKTFMRENSLINLLNSIYEHRPNLGIKIYIADDGPISNRKKRLYRNLIDKGNYVKVFSKQVGVGRARNHLLDESDEKYILRLDDDYQFCSETSIEKMKKVLDSVSSIGCISSIEKQIGVGKGVLDGDISPYQGDFDMRESEVVKKVKEPSKFDHCSVEGVRYSICDFTRNFLLCKRRVFNTVRWEENLTFAGEHIDFLLQLYKSNWKVAFTPDSIHVHNEKVDNPEYDEYLNKKWESGDGKSEHHKKDKILMEKWGIEKISVKYSPILGLKVLLSKLVSVLS
jgi:GT2 family glycosyltransferase